MTTRVMKPVRAWAAVWTEEGGRLAPCGAVLFWQFPTFPTRKDARAWRAEYEDRKDTMLVRVEIREVPRKAKR